LLSNAACTAYFAVLNGALLERQMVVLCPNLGELSGVVLSVTALLRWGCTS
jgi:hypothetical protein